MAQRTRTKVASERIVVDDLNALLEVMPPHIRDSLEQLTETTDLLEVVLDLGREPEARFPGREVVLSQRPISEEDLDYIIQRIGSFGDDNRAGIERTLHRISAIRNRAGRIIGLTARVGRAVFGTIDIIQEIVETGHSILLLGRPGVGKTTMLRETARVLASALNKRVVIVDTSNEIAGDGDIPHPAIGRARRMQVPTPAMQHQLMIEAVENHMPEVIVIDEIGNELEAAAARTIAERGVQLVATAHGNTLENLILNPTLSDLIGGIQTVTLGDEEARRRGTQKSVLERKAPPTFDVLVEIQDRDRVALHENLANTVDGLLRGESIAPQIRYRDERGEIHVTQGPSPRFALLPTVERTARPWGDRRVRRSAPWEDFEDADAEPVPWSPATTSLAARRAGPSEAPAPTPQPTVPVRIFPYGVNRGRIELAIRQLKAPAMVVPEIKQADVVMTIKNYYRRGPQRLRDAEAEGLPVYVLRSNTGAQIEEGVRKIAPPPSSESASDALQEVEDAIHAVLHRGQPYVELSPQNSYIRRLQHQIAERYNVPSRSTGREPFRRVMVSLHQDT